MPKKTYGSTVLRYVSDFCPKALGFFETGETADRSLYQAGIVAHACLERCTQVAQKRGRDLDADELLEVCDLAGEDLLTNGRYYQGKKEPPFSPEDVESGVQIAREYCLFTGAHWSPEAQCEVGLGITEEGRPCAYDAPECRYRAILDYLDLYEEGADEEGEGGHLVAHVTDYKTAWPTNAQSLDTTQSKGHAAIVAAHYPDVAVIRRTMINVRTTNQYTEDLWIDREEQDVETIERYRRNILFACVVADKTREARPGYNCLGCSYVMRCDDAWRPLVAAVGQKPPPEAAAELFALATAVRETVKDAAKAATKEEPIEVSGGFLVGHIHKAKQIGAPDVAAEMLAAWQGVEPNPKWRAENAETLGLLKALKLGNAQVDRVAKELWPRKPKSPGRVDFVSTCLDEQHVAEFGVTKK